MEPAHLQVNAVSRVARSYLTLKHKTLMSSVQVLRRFGYMLRYPPGRLQLPDSEACEWRREVCVGAGAVRHSIYTNLGQQHLRSICLPGRDLVKRQSS